MFEIYRMQLGQILGSRMKWLVIIILSLPVLLTLAVATGGALEELERELGREEFSKSVAAGVIPKTARRVTWEGEDILFMGGRLGLTREGLRYRGRSMSQDEVRVVNDGYLIFLDGQLWIDDTKKPQSENYRIRSHDRVSPDTPNGSGVTLTVNTASALYLFLLYPQALCLLISLFYGTSVLGHELTGKTLTYLFTRPLPRWKFILGKYLGIITALLIPTSLSLLTSWLILGALGGFSVFLALLAATVGALMAYNAIFILFGFLIPRRAMIVALLYGVVFEMVLSFVPALVNQFTITYYLRSFVVKTLDLQIPHEAIRVIGGASPLAALIAVSVVSVGGLAISSLLAANREFEIHDQA